MKNKTARSPFLFGAQYYRAPTPEPECWEADHARMEALGFNSVKYWLQWRWSHRRGDKFVFDDVLRLMDLAEKHRLAVTLNTIFDVAPQWLYEKYPDAKMIMNSGRIVEPETVAHRQIGGSPGPCYRHQGAREEREKFLIAAVNTFKGHPALDMWDLWNEPELCFNQRTPDLNTLACYCPHCVVNFRDWLREKYTELDHLNAVWGRCYEQWSEVEAPRTALTLTDFVDWREFHLDTITGEAKWRFATLRQHDPKNIAFLHTVPNFITIFNAVTCSDDFALAKPCDLYGASYNEGGSNVPFLTSPAEGKIVYNTEVHTNFGLTNMHQGQVHLPDLLKIFLPQIGMGVRGFQFWQFRAEVLGYEAPGWGVVKPDGTDRPITRAVETFWKKLGPIADDIATCPAPTAEVGVWKSRKNEIFHYAIHGSLQPLVDSVAAYTQLLYWDNIPYRVVDAEALATQNLAGLKFLILPSPYFLTQEESDALQAWVAAGGTLWNEAHLGGYNATTGRHSRTTPGLGLAATWGLVEDDSMSSYRLKLEEGGSFQGALVSDVEKALSGESLTGGKYFPIRRANGDVVWGAERCAFLKGDGWTNEAAFTESHPISISKQIGTGRVWYHGTNLGEGSQRDAAGFATFVRDALTQAGVTPQPQITVDRPGELHLDELRAANGRRFLVVANRSKEVRTITFGGGGVFRGLWTEILIQGNDQPHKVQAGVHDLLVEVAENTLDAAL